jgi:hypothetical protein
MNEPGLEFVWVGDDAIDPLEQAQTLQILVGAGIKTREEARADLGLGPQSGKGPTGPLVAKRGATHALLGKLNPHHDERGLFTTADYAAGPVGSPARKPRPTGVQVASLDNIATDATVDGGTADQAAIAQIAPAPNMPTAEQSLAQTEGPNDAAAQQQEKPEPAHGPTIVHDVPDHDVSLTAGDQSQFYAPPDADFPAVYADGQARWQNPLAAYFALKHFGAYDFQRQDGKVYLAYTNASNYAVGVYMAAACYSYDATIAICTTVANLISSNADANTQAPWWTKGWNDATNDAGPLSRSRHN